MRPRNPPLHLIHLGLFRRSPPRAGAPFPSDEACSRSLFSGICILWVSCVVLQNARATAGEGMPGSPAWPHGATGRLAGQARANKG